MKYHIRNTCSTLIIAGSVIAGLALAEEKASKGTLTPEVEAMMKKMEELGTPGAAHKALEPLVGDWTAEVKCWMAPEGVPSVTNAKAKVSWVMDGRFIKEEFSGEFMGKPFQGVSLTGYDNTKQKYNTVWVDNMHTSIVTAEGTATEGNKVITLEGKCDCPMTGEKDAPMKQVIRILSRDKHVFEMHDPRKGEDSKTMEITYTRTKIG